MMQQRVLVRRRLQSGDIQLLAGDVLSTKNGILRVKLDHQVKPIEVQAAETIPAEKIYGNRDVNRGLVIQKNYAPSPNALGNILNR